MSVDEPRITCPTCNGTGDVPKRVQSELAIAIRDHYATQVQTDTVMNALKEMARAKTLDKVKEIYARVEIIVWSIR